jgi:hypothetical protein
VHTAVASAKQGRAFKYPPGKFIFAAALFVFT